MRSNTNPPCVDGLSITSPSKPSKGHSDMADWQRTHTCGELRDTHVGQTVTLNGWVNTYRSYNNQVFVDLRDRYGITQVVFESDDQELIEVANGAWPRVRAERDGHSRTATAGQGEPEARDRQDRSEGPVGPRAERVPDAAVRDHRVRQRAGQRGRAAPAPLPRPAPQDAAGHAGPAPPAVQDDPRLPGRTRASSKSRRRCSARARRKGPATISCRAGSTTASGTPCRRARSSTSSS